MTALGVSYVVGIQPKLLMWPPGTGPKRKGRPLNNTGRRDEPDLISAKRIARDLPNEAWHTIPWREGSAEWLSSRFARVRVRVGHTQLKPELISEEWLLIEWPEGESEPTKYWLSTYRPTSTSANSSTSPSCAGVSSATIWNSSRKSGSGTSKGADGAASIITPRCASQLTDS